MKDPDKTKEQLINELIEQPQRIQERIGACEHKRANGTFRRSLFYRLHQGQRNHCYLVISPFSMANAVRAETLWRSSFFMRLVRCVSTVFTLI